MAKNMTNKHGKTTGKKFFYFVNLLIRICTFYPLVCIY